MIIYEEQIKLKENTPNPDIYVVTVQKLKPIMGAVCSSYMWWDLRTTCDVK